MADLLLEEPPEQVVQLPGDPGGRPLLGPPSGCAHYVGSRMLASDLKGLHIGESGEGLGVGQPGWQPSIRPSRVPVAKWYRRLRRPRKRRPATVSGPGRRESILGSQLLRVSLNRTVLSTWLLRPRCPLVAAPRTAADSA